MIKFMLLDTVTKEPKDDLKDVRVLVFIPPGIWQHRTTAIFVANGVYQFELTAPQKALYMIYVEIPSLKVKYKDLPSHKIEAVEQVSRANHGTAL